MGSSPFGCIAVRDVMVSCPFWVRKIEGSNPSVLIISFLLGVYSSMVERWPFKPRVLGSSPSAPNFYGEGG